MTDKKRVRAILIDPKQRTLTAIEIDTGLESIHEVLHCEHITASGRPLRGNLDDGFDSIYVSDDYLDERGAEEMRYWFQVDADRNPPSSYPIAGYGLAHGTDDRGEMCDVGISIEELRPRITFTQRKFKGFRTSEFEGEFGGMPAMGIKGEPIAPIIDGSEEE